LPGDEFHRAEEAGGIAGGKELFGIGALAARAAHFPGRREPDIDLAVIGRRMAVLAAAGGRGVGCVENFHAGSPWLPARPGGDGPFHRNDSREARVHADWPAAPRVSSQRARNAVASAELNLTTFRGAAMTARSFK